MKNLGKVLHWLNKVFIPDSDEVVHIRRSLKKLRILKESLMTNWNLWRVGRCT